MKRYSIDGEDFKHTDLCSLFDEMRSDGSFVVGNSYYEVGVRTLDPYMCFSLTRIATLMDECLDDIVGEPYQHDILCMNSDASKDLEKALVSWLEKHVIFEKYWVSGGRARERIITEQDVQESNQ